uniref:Uncharacterized protein n=1 Tax=Schizaphis graminum TaxID=13262 RepID=A0A2S2PJ88_SCHGA
MYSGGGGGVRHYPSRAIANALLLLLPAPTAPSTDALHTQPPRTATTASAQSVYAVQVHRTPYADSPRARQQSVTSPPSWWILFIIIIINNYYSYVLLLLLLLSLSSS